MVDVKLWVSGMKMSRMVRKLQDPCQVLSMHTSLLRMNTKMLRDDVFGGARGYSGSCKCSMWCLGSPFSDLTSLGAG